MDLLRYGGTCSVTVAELDEQEEVVMVVDDVAAGVAVLSEATSIAPGSELDNDSEVS